jgi:two-component system alkaline phosphatase synthesis response regulator PhoP
VDLTPTEFELLSLFMENPGHTYTREELLEKTLGYSYEGTGRTLDSHISNLRNKIEPNPAEPIYIETVHRIGYRFSKYVGK